MLHRAILGSFERFIRDFVGASRRSLAALALPDASRRGDNQRGDGRLRPRDARVVGRGRLAGDGRFAQRKNILQVREHSVAKRPVLLVVGKREAETQTVAVRRLGQKSPQARRVARRDNRRLGRRGRARPIWRRNAVAQKKSYPRQYRVAETVRAAVSRALLAEPGARFVTVREVRVSRDCGHANILYSLLGENDGAQAALNEIAPRLRRALGAKLRLRTTPNFALYF